MSEKYIVHTLLKKSFNFRKVKEEYYVSIIRLNIALCRKNYPDFLLHLHADKEGIDFLKKHSLLIYDTITISDISEILDSSYVNLFAAGKIELFSFFNKPFIHIDLDLLLLGKIEFTTEAKVFISHYEIPNFEFKNSYDSWRKWYFNDYQEIKEIDNYFSFINVSYAPNFSLFGSLDLTIIEKINEHYTRVLEIIKTHHKRLEKLFASSSILEQLSLNKIFDKSDVIEVVETINPFYNVDYENKIITLKLKNESEIEYQLTDEYLLPISRYQDFINDFLEIFDGEKVKVYHLTEKVHRIIYEQVKTLYEYFIYGGFSDEILKYGALRMIINPQSCTNKNIDMESIYFLYENHDDFGAVPNLCNHKNFIINEHDGIKFYETITNFLPFDMQKRILDLTIEKANEDGRTSIYPIDVLTKYIMSPSIRFSEYSPQVITIIDDINLKPEIVKLIKSKKTKIVFFYFTEGYFGMTDFDFDTITNLAKKYNFDRKDITVVTSNLIANEQYQKYLTKKNGQAKFVICEINYFFKSIWFLDANVENFEESFLKAFAVNLTKSQTTKKRKLFLNYNRRPHYHRVALATALLTNDKIKDKGWVSLGNKNISFSRQNFSFKETIRQIIPIDSRLNQTKMLEFWDVNSDAVDIKIDDKNLFDNQSGDLDLKAHFETFVSVVSETIVEENSIFFSEKIVKPIYCCQPFILFGNPGSLKKLKSLGYMTFGDFWDESYDEETNYVKRMEMIIDILETLSEKTETELYEMIIEMEPIFTHNYNKLLMGVGSFKELDDLLSTPNKNLV